MAGGSGEGASPAQTVRDPRQGCATYGATYGAGQLGKQSDHELCSSILIEHKDKIAKVRRDWKKDLCDPNKFAYQPKSAKSDIVQEVHAESSETWRLWKIE